MESNKSTSIVRKSSAMEIMMPPPKRIKRPKNVIDEESYTQGLSEIIARDFFPGLFELETKQEYLDALESQNEAWISSAKRRLEQVMMRGKQHGRRGTSLQTPLEDSDNTNEFATKLSSNDSVVNAANLRADDLSIDTNMSLDSFQSKYTSEDNESFYKLLDNQNRKRAQKYAWMWSAGNKLPSKMMLKQKEIELKLIQSRSSTGSDKREISNYLTKDSHQISVQGWKSKPNNGLMFIPDGVEDSVQTIARKAQNESRAAPKGISYASTRMSETFDEPGSRDSRTLAPQLKPDIRNPCSTNRAGLNQASQLQDGEMPHVNGYTFVDDEDEEEPEIPQVTKVINFGKDDLSRNPFTIKAQSHREDLLRRIVDKTAKSKRQSTIDGFTGRVEQTPVPKFPSSPKVGASQLTPAAKRLWGQVGTRTTGITHAFEPTRHKSGLRNRWTPS
ncbi:stress response protein bis1 [Blumeria hordei DH14]|uniref:Stress response protein bis1 n=1 Tax=Blumeria graminis f. sp. hordei (strain DH14) TaxID=546991 RepID=N1JCR1_BLUG1|nr:stress response protein bis1 [Blumeria hordei DH14]